MVQRRSRPTVLRRQRRRARATVLSAAVLLALVLGLAACSGGGGGGSGATATTAAAAVDRPSSPAKLSIVSPRNGQTVHGDRPEVRLDLTGARIVSQTTTHIQGDEGHIHLIVDGKLVNMNYRLSQRLPELAPGTHVLQVEFVAADHSPFDPRVLTQSAFTVTR
jgi:hypothetical protein